MTEQDRVEKVPRPVGGLALAEKENHRKQNPDWVPQSVLAMAEAKALAAAAVAAEVEDADMPRPFCKRFVGWQPGVSLFKPAGVPAGELELVILSLDEVESLRLADLQGQYQEAAADQMKISRATFARIVESARRKVADALVHGKALQIQIEPGIHPPPPSPESCHRRGCGCKGQGKGRGRFIEYPTQKEDPT